ncbi:hypothetical protein MMC17_005123 [Xylographa soralifera]|nr:hypothetical protein [Xylographa soralifera]
MPRVHRLGSTYTQAICGARSIHTSEPRNNESILGFGGSQSFDQGDTRRSAFRPMVKHGILPMYGLRWKKTRCLMRLFSTKARIDDFEGVEKDVEILFQTRPADTEADGQDRYATKVVPFQWVQIPDILLRNAQLHRQLRQPGTSLEETKKRRTEKPEAQECPEDEKRLFIDKPADATEASQELRYGGIGRPAYGPQHNDIYPLLDRLCPGEISSVLRTTREGGHRRYLPWVLNESARVQPGVPINIRQCIHDMVLPRGGGKDGSQPVAVMKGNQIVLNWYAMFRGEDIRELDAQEFKPERRKKKDSLG